MHNPTYVYEAGKARRKSSFQELLEEDAAPLSNLTSSGESADRPNYTRALSNIREAQSPRNTISNPFDSDSDLSPIEEAKQPFIDPFQADMAASRSSKYSLYTRFTVLAVVLAVIISLAQGHVIGSASGVLPGAEGGVIRTSSVESRGAPLARRADTSTDYCKRWSHQTALINGTLYIYGGRRTDNADQGDNQWNNDFLTLDLTSSWKIGTPTYKSLPRPSGPPSVANAYLWNSHSSLFLYGGEFSDKPITSPSPISMWEYDIPSGDWTEHKDPQTSDGKGSAKGGQAVQRVAEGAGVNVPSLGRGWYFGGHEDYLTTPGWSNQIGREYLRSFLEFTFPGAKNAEVNSLSGGKTAGSDGAWRNITTAGIQDTASFTERADGALVYVPGFGKEGMLLALGAGTDDTFTQMNVIDVFDIAGSTWYKQATSGPTPKIRVNPCAVVAAAADGTSYNIYMFGGQDLKPNNTDQTQYQDMWILTVPAFTWIQVDMDNQAVPYGRSGHTCNIWDGQMVVLGGYIGDEIGCEVGAYVFNMSSLQWKTEFTSLSGGSDKGDNANPFSQQLSQTSLKQQKSGGSAPPAGLEGSYGYQVPQEVIKAIGGNGLGRATVTAPSQSPTEGPLATGHPITYTVTNTGPTVTATSAASSGPSGPNIGAIVAGCVAGIAAVVAGYFAFCAWVYRKQLKLYKNHVAMVQRTAADPQNAEKEGFMFPVSTSNSDSQRQSSDKRSGDKSSSNKASGRSAGHQPSSSVDSTAGLFPPNTGYAGPGGYHQAGHRPSSDAGSSTDNLMQYMEPSFVGVLLNPRRSLRIVNND